jgi:nucleoside-diphosphate-sugar epimerase
MNKITDHRTEPLVSPDSVRRWLDDLPQPIVVTGGTGFVGSHLVDTLCAAGLRPRALVRNPQAPRWIGSRPVDWVEGSLEDRRALNRLVDGAGTVIHVAAVVRAARTADFDRGNHEGTARLLAAVREAAPSSRVVHVSSLAAVGPSASSTGIDPEGDPRPISDYGRSKLGAELEVRGIGNSGWWVMLRPPAVYGPRDTDIFQFFRMARSGLVLVPAGERWITVCYVADVVRGILAAAAGETGRVYHLGEPRSYRIEDMVRLLVETGGVRARVLRVPPVLVTALAAAGGGLWRLGLHGVALTPDKAREMIARHWTAQTADSLAELGIGDGVSFIDGAAETWSWYRGQGWLG